MTSSYSSPSAFIADYLKTEGNEIGGLIPHKRWSLPDDEIIKVFDKDWVFSMDDLEKKALGLKQRLRKKFQSIESHDDETIEEIDEDYVFPISAICMPQSPGNKINEETENNNNVDDDAKGNLADEKNLNNPLETQECLITREDDLKKKKNNGYGGCKRLRMEHEQASAKQIKKKKH